MNHYNQFLIRLDEQQQKEKERAKDKIYGMERLDEKKKDEEKGEDNDDNPIDQVIQQISNNFQDK